MSKTLSKPGFRRLLIRILVGPTPACSRSRRSLQTLAFVKVKSSQEKPHEFTAFVLHGLLGSGRNCRSFSRSLASYLSPSLWRMVLVDLRNHGISAEVESVLPPHKLESAVKDLANLVESEGWKWLIRPQNLSRCRNQSSSRHQHQSSPRFLPACTSVVSSFTLLKHDCLNPFSNWRGLHCCNIHRCSPGPSSSLRPAVEIGFKSEANMASDPESLTKRNKLSWKLVSEIVDILRNEGTDLDSRLCALASHVSIYSIIEVFEAINSRRISGLRFFEWIWSHNSQLRKNAVICSLIIDNVGRFDDYEAMSVLLKKFRSENVCLTYKAFGFLQEFTPANSSLTESTERVVDLLNSVGGSIRNSGVFALVEMFCKLDLFEMARYVIKITESKESYYCVMIREKCGRDLIEDAYGMIKEMREACPTTNTTVYNYLLARLCKNDRVDEALRLLDEMTDIDMHPDAITYEIVINSLCKIGMMDALLRLLNQMKFKAIKPRLSTHASVIKILFAAEKYESAYKYVVDSSIIFKASGNFVYGLLVKLYCEKGDIMSAQNTLVEMMEKNLKLDFSLYMKIVKLFRRSGRADLARDLQSRQSRSVIKSHTYCQVGYHSS